MLKFLVEHNEFLGALGSVLGPDFDLNSPDFKFHEKSGLFRTGPSPDSIPKTNCRLQHFPMEKSGKKNF